MGPLTAKFLRKVARDRKHINMVLKRLDASHTDATKHDIEIEPTLFGDAADVIRALRLKIETKRQQFRWAR